MYFSFNKIIIMENEERILELVGFVKISDYRTKVLKLIDNDMKMPSEIGKELNVRTNHISTVLTDLKKQGLVICVNNNVRKGRLYKNTDLGKKVLEYLK